MRIRHEFPLEWLPSDTEGTAHFDLGRAVTNTSFQFSSARDSLASNGKKELVMLNVEIRDDRTAVPHFQDTLWHCDRCGSYVSIHSAQIVTDALCPLCGDVLLELCGTFNNILVLPFADA